MEQRLVIEGHLLVIEQSVSRRQQWEGLGSGRTQRTLWEVQSSRDGSVLEGCRDFVLPGKSWESDLVHLASADYPRKVTPSLWSEDLSSLPRVMTFPEVIDPGCCPA